MFPTDCNHYVLYILGRVIVVLYMIIMSNGGWDIFLSIFVFGSYCGEVGSAATNVSV